MRKNFVLSAMWAELRLTRRLVRYWVFLTLALVSGLVIYLYYSGLHAFFSSFSGTVAGIGPRFLITAMGLYYVGFFLFGLVFMAFDVRARDVRERMVEVLDSRPMTTTEMLVGRFLAQLFAAWVPAWVMVGLMQLLGVALPALGVPFGETLEPRSLVMFTVFMCLPAMAFSLAMTYLITLLVRHRLVASVLTVSVLVALIWATFVFSPVTSVFVDLSGMYSVLFPSDILPGFVDRIGLAQRLGFLVMAGALLALATAVHPRLDGGSRGRRAGVGAALAVVALVLLGSASAMRVANFRQLDQWLAAHEARQDTTRADVQRVRATVGIEPGKRIDVEATLTLATPGDEPLDGVLLSLNPGFVVERVSVDGAEIPFTHAVGLLDLDLGLRPGNSAAVTIVYSGPMDQRFGYLDGVRTPERLTALDSQLYILGYERALNDRRYVALMPGVAWLPTAGVMVECDADTVAGPDFFEVELDVSVPGDWLVAGPGVRQPVGSQDDRSTFRFDPGAPVDGVAVVASRFEAVGFEANDIRYELLLTPGHQDVLDDLAEAGPAIRERIIDRMNELEEAGLPYPYDGLTVAEAPNALRGFGGGWRLGPVLGQPGLFLVREMGFPLARFDVPFRNEERWKDVEGGLPQAKLNRLEAFFINDFSGGNLFAGVGGSLFDTQCSARGPGREAVNWTLDELTTLLTAGTRGYFSAHLFSKELQGKIGQVIQGHLLGGGRGSHVANSVIEVFTTRPAVWDAVMDRAPSDIDPWEDPQKTIDGLSLKAGSLAKILYDDLGFEGTAALLASLRNAHSGGSFTLDDLVAAADAQHEGLGRMVEDLLTTTRLPGLVGQRAEAARLADAEDGTARYQLSVIVRNDEPTPGVFRVVYTVGDGPETQRTESDPMAIGGRETLRFATVLTRPPTGVWINPYLSLNRGTFRMPVPEFDEGAAVKDAPVEGVETLAYEVPAPDGIIVDDLDEGFALVENDGGGGFRIGGRGVSTRELDQGLPLDEFGPMPREWSRATSATAYGRYRHTTAWIRKGEGENRVRFTAPLPQAGQWELAVHLPHKRRFRVARDWGDWTIGVIQNGDRTDIEFGAGEAPRGWNLVDQIDLEKGDVTVEFSDATTGQIVVADAIRWKPLGGSAAEAGP